MTKKEVYHINTTCDFASMMVKDKRQS